MSTLCAQKSVVHFLESRTFPTLNALASCIFLFAVGVLGLNCSARGSDSPEVLTSIDSLKQKLAEQTGGVFDVNLIRRSSVVQDVLRTDSMLLFHQLLLDNNDPVVQAVGLICIQDKQPDQVLYPAARMILSSSSPTSPVMGFAAELLQSDGQDATQLKKLATVLGSAPFQQPQVAVLLRSLRPKHAIAIFSDSDLQDFPVASVSLLIEVVHDAVVADPSSGEAIKAKLSHALHELRPCTGLPRTVYLRLVDPPPVDFVLLLDSVLFDEDVDDSMLIPLLLTRGGDHIEHLRVVLPQLPESRQRVVRRIIERSMRR